MTDFALERRLATGETLSQEEVEDIFGTDFGYQFKGITYRHPDGGKYVILLANEGAIYDDEFGSGDEFVYTGEGVEEKGDQVETQANKALIDAIDDPIPIYLFTSQDGVDVYEYRGLATVEDHEYVSDESRMIYRFHMRELGAESWEEYQGESCECTTDKRLTCDRFFGGVQHRVENLRRFLQFVAQTSPSKADAHEWFRESFDAEGKSTRNRYLRFLKSLNLIAMLDGEYRIETTGEYYLAKLDEKILFASLDGAVAGFDLLLDALAVREALTDEELRLVLNNGPYGHDMDGTGVAVRHREWLQALGYADRENTGEGLPRVRLTESGYELWEAYEDGLVTQIQIDEDTEGRKAASLQEIAEDLTPRSSGQSLGEETISYKSNKKSQRAATTEHERAVGRLRSAFEEHGFTCKKTRHSDLIAYKNGNRVYVFEVKSTETGDLWGRIRKAVGQVLEYEYIDVVQREEFSGNSIPGLFLSSEPPDSMKGYLLHLQIEHEIEVLWWEDGIVDPSFRNFNLG